MKSIGLNEQQLQKMKTHPGFIAALDQSGGSTPERAALFTESKKVRGPTRTRCLRSCIRCARA